MEGFEILHKQWMSLITAQHPIYSYSTGRVPEIMDFVGNLRGIIVGKWNGETHKWLADAVRSTFHLPYAYMEDLKHFISNVCVFLQHSITFAILRGYLKAHNLLVI